MSVRVTNDRKKEKHHKSGDTKLMYGNAVRESNMLMYFRFSLCSHISALPQYLERYAARYANPLRV